MKTIIRLTFLEMRKKKILYLTLGFTIIFLIIYGVSAKYTYQSLSTEEAIIRVTILNQFMSMGIYIAGFIIAFLSIFSSSGSISSEIEKGTCDALLSKPIARYELVLGRLIGILSVLVPYVTFFYLSIIGINVFFGKGLVVNFALSSVIKALLVLYLLPIVLVSLGVFLSCSMSTMGSGIILVILYFSAMIGGFLEKIGGFMTKEAAKEALTNIGIITSLIMPSDVIYKKSTSLLFTTKSGLNLNLSDMVGKNVEPSSMMMAYIIIYIIVMIFLALRKFQKRDL